MRDELQKGEWRCEGGKRLVLRNCTIRRMRRIDSLSEKGICHGLRFATYLYLVCFNARWRTPATDVVLCLYQWLFDVLAANGHSRFWGFVFVSAMECTSSDESYLFVIGGVELVHGK